MPDRALPDDVSLWPTNPHELLGVGYDADARTARRAYLSLVRRFKPEHAPEQFKRIREAFEFVEQQIQAREQRRRLTDEEDVEGNDDRGTPDDFSPFEDEPPVTAEVSDRQDDPAAPAPQGVPLFAPDAEEECNEIWRDLCQGDDPAEAFARLVGVHRSHGGSGEACLRLYWLTVAAPQVDLQHGPCYWLTEGLRVSRLEGRLRELYRRELELNPHEAAAQRCGALLRLDAPPGALADLAEWRWKALGKIGRWDLVLADLAELRRRIVFDEEETWGRLLVAAIDQLAWSAAPPAQQAAAACRQELDAMSHLHAALERDLDRLDLLADAVVGWRRLQMAVSVPRAWTELIPLTWTRDYVRIRPKLLPVLREIAQDPLRALGLLDEMARHSPAAVAQLGFAIEAYRYAEERYEHDRRSEQELAAVVARFLLAHHGANYRAARRELFQFCLAEAVDPLTFAQAADALNSHLGSAGSWQDLIADDGPLRYVYAAWRAFRS